jgi:hydroxysqualene dehydroxylase
VDRVENLAGNVTAHVAIVGGGWAGLAAAVALCERGIPVRVFEASRHLGGRARRVTLDGIELDNGQHILIGAYRTTLGLMRKVGADPGRLLLRMPLQMTFADGFSLRTPKLAYPLNLAIGLLRAKGLSFSDASRATGFMAALQLRDFRVEPDRPASEWLAERGQDGRLRSHLWEPLCVSALNTPLEHASARVFANVLRDALAGARENSDLLVPRADLGRLFPEPAAAFIREHGGEIQLGAPIRRLLRDSAGIGVDDTAARFSDVIVATGPQHAAALVETPELAGFSYEPITTCYLQYPDSARMPCPMLGIADGLIQWVFDRGQLGGPPGLMAAVISGSGEHASLANETLGAKVHEDLARYFPDLTPRWTRVIGERRATFSCRPNLARPSMHTRMEGVVLCGDYLDPAYPGTIEAAMQSGLKAAAAIPAASKAH